MLRIAALHLPDLAVQAVLRERYAVDPQRGVVGPDVALALVDGPEDRRRITACTALARDCGVRPGQAVAAARGSCPELIVVDEDPVQTADSLGVLADAVGIFGPTVSLAPPESVLVDTTGVCGVTIDGQAFVAAAAEVGFLARAAIASTPFAALALAAHGAWEAPAEPRAGADERRAVERLPLIAARLPARAYEALHVVGIRTVGAFMSLPPASLARRFGGGVRRLWLEAHGRAVPRLTPWDPTPLITERACPEDAIERLDPLCFLLKTLVDRVLKRLKGRGQGVEQVRLELRTSDPASLRSQHLLHALTLDLGRPSEDGALVLQLLRERLQHVPPPGPVERLELTVMRSAPMHVQQLSLFDDPAPAETVHTTVARLAAVMGQSDPRFTAGLQEDYRPERAWTLQEFRGKAPSRPAAAPPGPRPARLLRSPHPIDLVGSAPPHGAVSGPERLVSGWWDAAPMARDYWIVADRWGRRSWVFRDLATDRWFLHGHFD